MATYWIKLYIEIIDDSKMALLPDRLWRRVIELFLMAGKHGGDGKLPDSRRIAWELRIDPADVALDLEQLASTGIISRTGDGWIIPKFKERQAASPVAERVKKYRETRNENVTKRYNTGNDVTHQINRLTESEAEAEAEADTEQKPKTTPPPPASKSSTQGAVDYTDWGQSIHMNKAQGLLLKASQLPAIPTTELNKIDVVYAMMQEHGEAATFTALTQARDKWVRTQGKSGKTYSPINFGWVDWALGIVTGEGLGKKVEKVEVDPFESLIRALAERKAAGL